MTYVTGAGNQGTGVCLKVVPVRVRPAGGDQYVETFALLDDCSDVSLCTSNLAATLGVVGKEVNFTLNTVNKSESQQRGMEVSLSVHSLDNKGSVDLERVWTVDEIPVSEDVIPTQKNMKSWPHLEDVEIPALESSKVSLLIGSDVPEVFWALEERRGKKKEPYAVRSILGWTLIGPTGPAVGATGNVNFTHSNMLQEQVERMWKTDFNDIDCNEQEEMSLEDKRALSKMEESLTVTEDGHYQLSLPWRHQPPILKNNHRVAESRMLSVKARLRRDHELHQMYSKSMQDYLDKGHASEVPDEFLQNDTEAWYLPHHPVFHPRKPNKVRVVFDCAAQYQGTSLNDQLLKGPDQTNNLLGVLMRFRKHPIAMMADIESMFNQVRVTPADRKYLRFLWWPEGNFNETAKEYCMNVHLFGATSSPSCASFCLRRTARDHHQEVSAEAVETVNRNFYVDDCLKSVASVEEGVNIAHELSDLLQKKGFKLTKWISSNKDVLKSIPSGERASAVIDLDLEKLPTEKSLGVTWEVEADQLQFAMSKVERPSTSRGILSVVSALYDPLGFVAPVVLPAKRILQNLCKRQLDWDEVIPEEEILSWLNWVDSVDDLKEIKVPRCMVPAGFGDISRIEAHNFSDASEVGYGAVSYLRFKSVDGRIHCAFIIGKSRVSPLKTVSIPRLELTAATVAVRLDSILKRELDMKIDATYFWTDSTSVLAYIRNENRRFKTFVANRLAQIHNSTDVKQWRYVDTRLNPADHASRGLRAQQKQDLSEWLQGPNFLWQEESLWPTGNGQTVQVVSDDPELKRTVSANVNITQQCNDKFGDLLRRYSDWTKLKKSVAWLKRYKQYLLRHVERFADRTVATGYITVQELRDAEMDLVKYVQKMAFPDEVIKCAQGSKESVSSSSALRKLSPWMEEGVLRVGGRLNNAPIPYSRKHPIILPSKHVITDLVIREIHVLEGHCGQDHVLATVRNKFWVVHGRVAVRRVLGGCFSCRKRTAPVGEQFMAPLPEDRLKPDSPPFTHVGVDYFGPMQVKQGRSVVPRYGCLFTCLVSRAIHVEIAHSLDTDSFLNALTRFISRRGKPNIIRSDNGTNLKSGERELREALQAWNQEKIHNVLLQKEIKWIFNPPSASHMGGVWERLVRSIKTILKMLVKEQLLSDESLLTLMAEVERVLNNRPLTPVSDDPNDLEPLTPNHLLLQKSNESLPLGTFNEKDCYSRRRWRQIQYLANIFWTRWLKEYLPLLQVRQKWLKTQRNLKVGDIVMMSDPNSPRGKWPLARVTKVYPGADGLVRSVQVRTANSYLDRPVSKLCFLEETVDDCPVAESTDELGRGSSVGGAVDTPRDVGGKDELDRGSSVGGAVDTPRDVGGKDELDRGSSVGGAVDTPRDLGGKDELDRDSSVGGSVDTPRDVGGKDELDRGSSVGGAVDTPRDVGGKDELDRGSSVGGAVDTPRDVGGKDELDRGSSVSGAVDTPRDVGGEDELDRGSSVGGAVDTPRDVGGKDGLDRGSSVGGAVDTPRDVGGKDEDLGQMNATCKRPVRSRRAPKGHEDFVRYWSGICLLIANGLGHCWLISLAVGRGNLYLILVCKVAIMP